MAVHKLPELDDKVRLVPFLPGAVTIKRDFVPPVAVGTYIAMVFRVTEFTPDCDGSAMATLVQVNQQGEETGWEADNIGLYADIDVVLDGPGDLHELIKEST